MDCVAFGATHIPIRFRLPMVLLSAFLPPHPHLHYDSCHV